MELQVNTSGQGTTAVVPEEIKGWNWGAFLMSWIWAIGNQTWIGLLALLPYVGLIISIVLGIKGSEWAWQNRRWESVDQFRNVQGIWMKWGVALFFVSVALTVFAVVLPMIARP